MPEAFQQAGPNLDLGQTERHAFIDRVAEDLLVSKPKSILLIPPDISRLDSQTGPLTTRLYHTLTNAGVRTKVLPALGTHRPMTTDQLTELFGPDLPHEHILAHRWRQDLIDLGELDADWIDQLSDGKLSQAGIHWPMKVAVNRELIEADHDIVVSLGQVVPHEVIGIANYTKNILIGVGGPGTIHLSHFLGAVCGMESIMGRVDTPVRTALDRGFNDFVKPKVDIRFVFTAVEATDHDLKLRGLYYGSERESFTAAAELSRQINIHHLDQPIDRCVVHLDPAEFTSTWLGNKAVYRTRCAMADGGTLLVLAPGVETFGEDPAIDQLIRRFGYRGTPATLKAICEHPELADNLSAAAHLIHASSEGRFRIIYATADHLSKEDVESVGFEHADLKKVTAELGLQDLTPGHRILADGHPAYVIDKPALGLWSA
ncbi:lactate racemase domain-containing protein [Mucisphaera sp.]|uniref:lactate racemase domain-containing protein n=1 Tax=Mucisphaera sp. TaxID=2913024 RepID=UPI003D0E3459